MVPSYFDVRVESPLDDVIRIPVAGELDPATSDVLFHVLVTILATGGAERVDVDLTEVTLLDASGVGVLLAARNRAIARGRTLRVYGAAGLPLRVLEITGVLGLLGGKSDTQRRATSTVGMNGGSAHEDWS